MNNEYIELMYMHQLYNGIIQTAICFQRLYTMLFAWNQVDSTVLAEICAALFRTANFRHAGTKIPSRCLPVFGNSPYKMGSFLFGFHNKIGTQYHLIVQSIYFILVSEGIYTTLG